MIITLRDNKFYSSQTMLHPQLYPLQASLEIPYRLSKFWSLAYSTTEHGRSLSTLLRECNLHSPPYLLVVKDTLNYVFGAFFNDSFEVRDLSYGPKTTYLFSFQDELKVFTYAFCHPFICLCNDDRLAFGCSDGYYGLMLDRTLLRGESYSVRTFENEVLSGDNEFTIHTAEVWSINM
ncbi:TLD domain-containing protein 2 [Dictyocoela roeselum]|nr:TLD domain-containing protein 2 [Dictyocoela roeselum]